MESTQENGSKSVWKWTGTPLPEKVYKYTPVNEFTPVNLKNNQLFFSTLDKLNDPLEGKVSPNLGKGDSKNWEKKLNEIWEMWAPKRGFDVNDISARKNFLNRGLSQQETTIPEVVKHAFANYGACSFSEIPPHEGNVLFAHYASQHKGICLEFSAMDHESKNPIFGGIWPIVYHEHPPDFSVSEVGLDLAMSVAFFSKSRHWAYEKEWRAAKTIGNKTYQYNPNLLTGIYLGARISSEDKDKIIEVFKDAKTNIYQATEPNDKYSIEMQLLKRTS